MSQAALVVGVGGGISASVARALASSGYAVHLAARNADKLAGLAAEIGATVHACDASLPGDVAALFEAIDGASPEALRVVVYNASGRLRGPIAELDAGDVLQGLKVSAFGGFLVGQAAAQRMTRAGRGTILFTGASASTKGFAQSAPFAMGKFALRGLAQSMARELQPKGIHVAHVIIDGSVRSVERGRVEGPEDAPDRFLDPDAIADAYLMLINQPRSAWSYEIELRPWVESF